MMQITCFDLKSTLYEEEIFLTALPSSQNRTLRNSSVHSQLSVQLIPH